MEDRVSLIISYLMTAVSNCSLYYKEHEAVDRFSAKAVEQMEGLLETNDSISFTILGEGLIFNDTKIPEKNIPASNFIKKLKRKGIEKVFITKGVNTDELKEFVSALASPFESVRSSPHIAVGVVEVKLSGGADVSSEVSNDIEKLKEINGKLSRFGTLDMVGLEDVVISFIGALRREANVLRVLSPVKTHSEYTFTHTTNVTILSIFLAEHLGLKGDIIHEVGLAGLLHDIGKTFIPKEVLEKQGKLTDEEWQIMKNHTLYGAMYLAFLRDVPKLAVIVAYEHHMKYDGSGYPQTLAKDRKQHIISQIIAIADFFDALRTERPYRRAMEVPVIMGLMKESSGKEFNPVLMDGFFNALAEVGVI